MKKKLDYNSHSPKIVMYNFEKKSLRQKLYFMKKKKKTTTTIQISFPYLE